MYTRYCLSIKVLVSVAQRIDCHFISLEQIDLVISFSQTIDLSILFGAWT